MNNHVTTNLFMTIKQAIAQIQFQLPQLANGTPESNEVLLSKILKPVGETMDALAAALKQHHEHSNNGPVVHFTDEANPPGPVDMPLPTNLADAYQESQLWDDTRDALCMYAAQKG